MEEKKIPPIEKAYLKTNTLKSIYSTCPAQMTNGHIGWTLPVDKTCQRWQLHAGTYLVHRRHLASLLYNCKHQRLDHMTHRFDTCTIAGTYNHTFL